MTNEEITKLVQDMDEGMVHLDYGIVGSLFTEDSSNVENPFKEDSLSDVSGVDLSNWRDYHSGQFGADPGFSVPRLLQWMQTGKDPEGAEGELKQWDNTHHWRYVYLLSHGGIHISHRDFGDPWDSGVAGIAFISKKAMIENQIHGVKKHHKAADRELKAQDFLRDQIQLLDDYLNNNVWYWEVTREGDAVDSVCGYWGDSGLEEARKELTNSLIATRTDAVAERELDLKYVDAARARYVDEDQFDFDDYPKVSRGEDKGAYVQCWVWVRDEDAGIESDGE